MVPGGARLHWYHVTWSEPPSDARSLPGSLMAPSTPDVHAEPQWLVHALRTEISGADVRSKLEHEWRTQPAHARIAIAELMREYILQQDVSCARITEALAITETSWCDVILDTCWALDAEMEVRCDENLPLETARSRLADVVRAFVTGGLLTAKLVASRLDAALLGAIGLLDANVFQRRGIQIRTATFFKQPKYNLLREENAGYAALFMSLESCIGPAMYADGDTVVESETARDRDVRAESWLQTSMLECIGRFGLDAVRVLDIILASFCAHAVHHYPFFLSVMRRVPWSSARIAEVLGFQYAHYTHPDTRESTPEELYLLTALLIREKVVSFAQMLAYVSPDDTIQKLKQAHDEALTSKTATVGANALTMAAPLIDDDHDSSAASSTTPANTVDAAPPPPPSPQGIFLIRALLRCGALDEVRGFLAAHPWIFGAYPSVTHAYLRLVWYRLDTPAFRDAVTRFARTGNDQTSELTMYVPEPHATRTHRYIFCVRDWAHGHAPLNQVEEVFELLSPLGVYVCQDRRLLQLLCRVCAQAPSKEAWMPFLRTQVLPAVTLANGGAPLLYELWECIQTLPYPQRYSLYGEWKHRSTKRPELRYAKMQTEREARGILRRISSDNVRASGRSLAKAAHAHPTVFFEVVLHQIQSYDNLIEPVVDSAKYLTPLEYDVLTYALLEALSDPGKARTKQDGTNTSLWLKSLASFAGALFRKYAAMDCTPILQYLANRLHEGQVADLIVLSELILKMAGIEPMGELSDAQMAALSGGPLLQTEAHLTLIPGTTPAAVLLARNSLKKGAMRLYRTLMQNRLAVPLLILVAQQREACVFSDDDVHIKSLSSTFDTCVSILLQYTHFLMSQGTSEYAQLVPSPSAWIRRFGVDVPIAYHLGRLSPDTPENCGVLGPLFFGTFWQLSLPDLVVPMERYQHELDRLKQALQHVETTTDMTESLKTSARVRLQESMSQLQAELKEQTLAHQATRRRLQTEKGQWFHADIDRAQLIQQLVAQCLYPRALFSPTDAVFAARFLRTIHTLGTPHLPTLGVYDTLLTQHVAPTLFLATENEARSYARFLYTVLHDLHAWLVSPDAYDKEAIGSDVTGFSLAWHGMRGMHTRPDEQPLSFTAFKACMLQWHSSLYEAFSACFGVEYMRMRNAIVVLNRLSAFFPLYRDHGQRLLQVVQHVVATEHRGDLKVLAQGLAATLEKHAPKWVDVTYFRPLTKEERARVREEARLEEERKEEERKEKARREEERKEKLRREEERKKQAREEEARREEKRRERARQEEARREEERQEKARQEEARRETRKEEAHREQARPRDTHHDEARNEGRRPDAREESRRGPRSRRDARRDDEPREVRIRGARDRPKESIKETPRDDPRSDRGSRGRWSRERQSYGRYDRQMDRSDEGWPETNAQWGRRRVDGAAEDEHSARKRSLADRLGSSEGGASDAQSTPDSKRMRKERMDVPDRGPPARSWGRGSGRAPTPPRDVPPREHRERDRRKRRAGGEG